MEIELRPEDEIDDPHDVWPDDTPGYFRVPQQWTDEGRRVYALSCVISDEGVLAPNWREEVMAIEEFLRNGKVGKKADLKPLRSTHPSPVPA